MSVVELPDLRFHGKTDAPPAAPRAVDGWFALTANQVSVPTILDAQRCAREALGVAAADPCDVHVAAFDPPNRTTLIALPANGVLTIQATVTPGFPVEQAVTSGCSPSQTQVFQDLTPVLVISSEREGDSFSVQIPGTVVDPLRQQLLFQWTVPGDIAGGFANGLYSLAVQTLPEEDSATIDIALGAHPAPVFSADACAITLTPGATSAGSLGTVFPTPTPRAPLLAVDGAGCIAPAWSIDAAGRVLVPGGDSSTVLFQPSCRGGLIAALQIVSGGVAQPIQDAIFWLDRIALLSATEVRVFDLQGCPATPAVLVTGLGRALALGVSDEGFLMVIERDSPNLRLFRRDGSEVLAPSSFDGRGFYARHRNGAFFFAPTDCTYHVNPSLVASGGCCADAARPLTDDESLFFRLIDDLRDLRNRTAYPPSGQAILGPAQGGDPLDSGLPGSQWHRILFFGDIPAGCAIKVETRASDDILAGDPLVPTGWSLAVTATTSSRVDVASPGDERAAAAAVMVLAGAGRFLWLRLTLLSNGPSTPRITGIELEQPRDGISRFLPKFIQNSTPEDDFLRRWLALFENAAFDGVSERMDDYAELFDPRTAPAEMLPFLAGWLQVLELARFQDDEDAFRFALSQAAELAQTRGTIDGLILAVRIYMGISIQIVESFKRGSGFVLGLGTTIDGLTGPALGCQTMLSAEDGPTWLGDAPVLGDTFLLDCERRFGTVPFAFDVLVAARDVCLSENLALLTQILNVEKPAHTTFRIRQTGAIGFVLGNSVIGQSVTKGFDRNELDPATFGILVQGGPPRPEALGEGFTLGHGSRLVGAPPSAGFRVDATLGRTTRL
jgi:phage tail-like protein